MSPPSALILSTDALLAALLGAAVETLGLTPAFPTNGEPPRQALARLRPRLVLVDCEHEEACASEVLGPARMLDARVVLFGSADSAERRRDLARRHGVELLTLPAPQEALTRALERARGGGVQGAG